MNGYSAVINSRHFGLHEFARPEDLKLVRPDLIYALDDLRERWGRKIHPSRHPDGLVRFDDGTSRHSTNGHRLTDAIDVFPEGPPAGFLVEVLEMARFHGIGVYGDTRRGTFQPGPMFHLDLRSGGRFMWVRHNGEYVYRNSEPARFHMLLQEILSS